MTAPPPPPQWLTSMKMTQTYMHACFTLADFSFFEARGNLQQRMPSTFTSHFHKAVAEGPELFLMATNIQPTLTGDASKELADEATRTTDKLQQQVQDFSREITAEANNKPTDPSQLPGWKKKLMDKNEENKKALAKMCDESMEKAMDKIAEMPPEKREEAADKWTSAWDWIMKAVQKIIEFLDNAWMTIVNLWNALVDAVLKGIEQVKQWAADVGSAIMDNVSKIKDIFSF